MPKRLKPQYRKSEGSTLLRRPPRRLIIRHASPKKQLSIASAELQRELELRDTVEALQYEIKNIPDRLLRDQYAYAMTEVAKDGNIEHLLELTRYVRGVVPLDEFLHSPTYMGIEKGELYPGVLETLEALESEQYVECVMKGAIGGGKTTCANLGIARNIYKISCMRNPQQTFGVQQHSSIVFTIQSVRLTTAKQAVFEEMGKFFNNSPYFREIFPYDRRINSQMKFLKHNVQVLPVSSSASGAISMNVIGGLLDEVNFMQKIQQSKSTNADDKGAYDQAKELYLTLSKRRRSRFMHKGKLPGTLFLVSSSRYPDDFTEIKAAEAQMCGGDDPEIYVFSKSLWESKGRERYSPYTFRVLVGNERTRSRILGDQEQVQGEGLEIIDVPIDFRREFEKDIDGSIRDFAGHTTLASRPFIHNRESVFECMELADAYDYQSVIPVEDIDLEVSVPTVLPSRIRDDVNQMRVCHVDLAVTRDSAGIAIGHIAGVRTMERLNAETGERTVEVLPVIGYDLILRVLPPRDGEIDFGKIRQIIYDLRDNHNMPIKVVTTDGFQSTDFRQILGKKGFATDYLSLDRTTEPYRTFRDALYDKRILLPRHQTLVRELTELEYVKTNNNKEKVDHKPRGSKDVADAVCGVAAYLLTRRRTWAQQPTFRGDSGLLLHGHRTGMGTVKLEELSEDELFERHASGRRSIKERRSLERVAPRRRKTA
jgi:hypothetical protein